MRSNKNRKSSGLIQIGKISAGCAIYNIKERDIRRTYNLKEMDAMERKRYSAPYNDKSVWVMFWILYPFDNLQHWGNIFSLNFGGCLLSSPGASVRPSATFYNYNLFHITGMHINFTYRLIMTKAWLIAHLTFL